MYQLMVKLDLNRNSEEAADRDLEDGEDFANHNK